MWVGSLGQEDPLEKEMTTYSSIFAWEIPETEELGWAMVHGVTKEADTTEQLHYTTVLRKEKLTYPSGLKIP